MIKECIKDDEVNIIKYINGNYDKCIYIFLDFIKYGFLNPNVRFYFQFNNGNIGSLIMKYYNGMHIYSADGNINKKELLDFINQQRPSIICCERKLANMFISDLDDYSIERGWIRKLDNLSNVINFTGVERVKDYNSFSKIATLLLEDKDISNTYDYEELFNQIKERSIEEYGRNYVIKQGNEIISHAGTGAENDKIAVLNYVMTSENHREQGLATKVVSKACIDLINEGKTVYLVNYTDTSSHLYDKIGFKVCCDWVKLYIDDRKEGNKNE